MVLPSAEPEGLPEVPEQPVPEKRRNVRVVLAALAVVCVIGLPLAFFIGFTVGHDYGYEKGYDTGMFRFYYVKPANKRYGVYELSSYLNQ